MGACGSKGAAIASTVSLDSIQRVDSIVPSSGRIRTNSEMDRLKRRAVLDQMRKDNEIFTPEVRRVGAMGGRLRRRFTRQFYSTYPISCLVMTSLTYFTLCPCHALTDRLLNVTPLTDPHSPTLPSATPKTVQQFQFLVSMTVEDQGQWSDLFDALDENKNGTLEDEEVYNGKGMQSAGIQLPFMKTLFRNSVATKDKITKVRAWGVVRGGVRGGDTYF